MASLGRFEHDRPIEGERAQLTFATHVPLGGVQRVNDPTEVTRLSQVRDVREEAVWSHEEVREYKHGAPPHLACYQILEGLRQRSGLLVVGQSMGAMGADPVEGFLQDQIVRWVATGGHHKGKPLGAHRDETDGIILVQEDPSQSPGQARGEVKLCFGSVLRCEVHGSRIIQDDIGFGVGFPGELANVVLVAMGKSLPVEMPQVIARGILFVLGELHGSAGLGAGVDPRESTIQPGPDREAHCGQSPFHIGSQQGPRVRGQW